MFKIFNKWDTKVEIKDPGLKDYINLKPVLVPKTFGRHAKQQFHKSNLNIIERLMNHLYVPGHRGKRHRISSGRVTGKSTKVWEIMKNTLEIIEKKTKENPIEVLVRAIENAALREEITSFQVGGIIVRKAVITSPQRRVDMALRLITQGAYQKAFDKPKNMAESLADEIIAACNNDSSKSHAIRERERIEREAAGAR
ncbi:MAG: 30S ribosomal protein S7 [Candidatus Aenigmatarchaeota archaeon]